MTVGDGDIIDERDTRFTIASSTIPGAGKGLFAKMPLAEGDRLEVIGVPVRPDSVTDRCTQYADRYKFRIGDTLLIPLGYGGMVNHSNSPNMEKILEEGKIYLRTLRAIPLGEELTFTYNVSAQADFSAA